MNEKLGPDIAVVGRHTRKSSNESGNVERSAGLGRRERGESVQRDRGVLAGEHSSDTRLGVSVKTEQLRGVRGRTSKSKV